MISILLLLSRSIYTVVTDTDLDTIREMAEEYKTPAAKALRKHYDELVSVIREPDLPTLGAGFFSLEVISRQTMEMVGNVTTPRTVRISKLLLAMMSHLDLHPEKFDSIMDVLNQELVDARVSRDISDTHGELLRVNISFSPYNITL